MLNEQVTSVGKASQNGEGAGETLEGTLPGTYSLYIAAAGNVDYVISVRVWGTSQGVIRPKVTQRQALT